MAFSSVNLAKNKVFLAAANGDGTTFDKAIEDYEKVANTTFNYSDIKDADQRTVSHYAYMYNTEGVARHVLQKRKATKMKWWDDPTGDCHGAMAFMYACRRGFSTLLTECGYSSFHYRDSNGRNALHYSFGGGPHSPAHITGVQVPDKKPNQKDLINCAEYLLTKGLYINEIDNSGKPPLVYAVENELDAIVNWFCNQEKHVVSLLQDKVLFPNKLMVSLNDLIKITDPNESVLHKILCIVCDLPWDAKEESKENRIDCAKTIFSCLGKFVFTVERCALRYAVNSDFIEMVEYLYSVKSCIEWKAVMYKGPLEENEEKQWIIYETMLQWFIRTLFEKHKTNMLEDRIIELGRMVEGGKCDVNATDDLGRTPLHQLCFEVYEIEPRTWRSLRVGLAEKLISLKAEVNLEDTRGRTPLMLAGMAGHKELVQLLLTSGVDPDRKNKWGHSAMSLETVRSVAKSFNGTDEASNSLPGTRKDEEKMAHGDAVSSDESAEMECLVAELDHVANSVLELKTQVDGVQERLQKVLAHPGRTEQRQKPVLVMVT